MKEFLIAGALLHTFTVAPQPTVRNATQYNNLEYEVQYQNYQTLTGTVAGKQNTYIVEKAKSDFGLYTIDLYRISQYYENSNPDATNTPRAWVYGIVNKRGTWDESINVSAFHFTQYYYAYADTGITENVEYYLSYGLGDPSYTTLIQTMTYNSINSFPEYPISDDSVTQNLIGDQMEGVELTNEDTSLSSQFTFMFYIGEEDSLYQLSAGRTKISYNYSYEANTEGVIDLPGLLWNILAMPFGFLTQAFNLTLFPGTAYAVNIGETLLALVSALMIIFIVRRFTR